MVPAVHTYRKSFTNTDHIEIPAQEHQLGHCNILYQLFFSSRETPPPWQPGERCRVGDCVDIVYGDVSIDLETKGSGIVVLSAPAS